MKGALSFICSTLVYKSQSKTLTIVESGECKEGSVSARKREVVSAMREVVMGMKT